MRGALYLGFVVAGACASAGKPGAGGDDVDAPPAIDAPQQIDAPVDLCTSSATCQAAIDLGSVSGDTGHVMVMANGYQAAWYKVRVTEDDNSVGGVKLSMTAQLTSPPNAVYDVFVYVNTGNDAIECNTPSGQSSQNGATENLRIEWGEGTIANGSDDGRTVSIEVRPHTGSCSAAAPWQLVVLGDT